MPPTMRTGRARFAIDLRTAAARAIATAGVLAGFLALPSLAQARPTYVSLTFDDGAASQASAVSAMAAHGMRGTFYINSGSVGSDPYFMDWPEIQGIAAAGHEIGGHTTTHPDLTTLAPSLQELEICGDREALQAHGFDPVSFAYPFAKSDASSRAATQLCGYTSARGVGNAGCLPGCAPAESLPPPDPTLLRTAAGVTDTTSLATLQGYVENAVENGGGWVILVFHTFCTNCGDTNSMTAANFDALLDFIQGQTANGVSVKTVREAMAIPPTPPPPNVLQNASLENGLTSSGPACWTRSSFDGPSGGGSLGSWSGSSDAHTGANAEQIDITSFSDGDRKLSSTQNPACSPAATPGHIYQAGAWYKTSAGANVRMIAYYRDAAGVWQFWREQPLPASIAWSHALWQTPKAPAGAQALSIGFSLRSVGSATVDDFSLGDMDADYQAPVSSATSPTYSTAPNITVTYTAADEDAGSGVATVDLYAKAPGESGYTKVQTSPSSSGSFHFAGVGAVDGVYSFYTVATDAAGNREATATGQTTTLVDSVAPRSSATSPSWSASTTVTVSYTAADNAAASGLATVDLYAKAPGENDYAKVATDAAPGSSGSFGYIAAAGDGIYNFYTVATDKAANQEATPSAADATTNVDTVPPDTVAPHSSATSPAYSTSTAMTVAYTASDSGSGLATVELWAKAPAASAYTKASTDTTPSAAETFAYSASGGDGSYRFYTVATDRAGNREATSAAQATTLLDTIVPVSAASAPASSLKTALMVGYTASDAGSGLATVELWAKTPATSAFTKVSTDTTPTASESFSYTAAGGDGSYRFYTVATDRAGKRETTSAAQTTTVVDTVVPAAQNIRSDNGSGSDGKADTGDTVTFTYSEAMSPASIIAAWSGASTAVLVKLGDASNSADTLQVWSADNAARLAVANPLLLNGDYVPSSGAVFKATMVLSSAGNVLTVTLGSLQSGSVKAASKANTQRNGPLKWTPDARATDRAGNHVNTTAVSKPGTAF